jgi:hypothetical protein
MQSSLSPKVKKILLVSILILVAAWSRLIPHAPNFSAVGAMALFSGCIFGLTPLGLLLPLAAMFSTDLLLGFHDTIGFVYAGFLMQAICGAWVLRTHQGAPGISRMFAGTFLGACAFFLITNLGVFAVSGMYPHTLMGMSECFILALPFFKNEWVADFLFVNVLFFTYAGAQSWIQAPSKSAQD